jgi:hypothetical protein
MIDISQKKTLGKGVIVGGDNTEEDNRQSRKKKGPRSPAFFCICKSPAKSYGYF